MKPKRHEAVQSVSPVLDPVVKLSLSLSLEGDLGRLWREYAASHQDLSPSNAQLAVALLKRGLESWSASR